MLNPSTPKPSNPGIDPVAGPAPQRKKRLLARLHDVRGNTEQLVATLGPEDQNLQSMPEASPAKWHRAHTTWFFETFVLQPFKAGYQAFNPAFAELFNSYYNAIGEQHARARRALISRPDVETVSEYRQSVGQALDELIKACPENVFDKLVPLIELGLNHEQQHQELMLTDLKHAFHFNPLAPAIGHAPPVPAQAACADPAWLEFDGGTVEIGAVGDRFCFDNELPRHRVYLNNRYQLANRPVTCGEFSNFIDAGGYADPLLWLADGWAWIQQNNAQAPLYWSSCAGDRRIYTLSGWREMDPSEPVCHLNFYEASAFAEWSGCRLPTEAEWEAAAVSQSCDGHFADQRRYHPQPIEAAGKQLPAGMFGDVWEWTSSPYAPYPGFQAAAGAIGEYNGKFMANQMVLRGGSCATPKGHVRATYRNFFYPVDRWQFSGLRLARDA
ncbi:MAG: ergothioneine biosynthesis protein EgtB [Wenzhouxiangellaceae bacterium]|nr:ergothioneine biosynthesis protein EgtB [Wenzhouxiangellaceae bacterium]